MSRAELAEVVHKGLNLVGMTIEENALQYVTGLSQGVPHFTHLLAQLAARSAAGQGHLHVDIDDVNAAVSRALDRTQPSIIDAYDRGVLSSRESLYEPVVLACALAPVDERGFFTPAAIQGLFSRIVKRHCDLLAFAQHLHALSTEDRGPILQKVGTARHFRFQFVNPLMRPYIIMKGLTSGRLDAATLESLVTV